MKRLNILLLIMVSVLSKAQIKTFDIPSPNASDLGRYGDIPVSYYTGKANINIPLYSLTVKGVTVPVTLNYDASGVLVNKLPGWLGDNWSLSAGGIITRIVQDVIDEYVGHEGEDDYPNEFERLRYEHNQYIKNNYFKSHSVLSQFSNFTSDANKKTIKDSVYYRQWDLSPDIFYFNFLGKTGRFFLGNDGQWKVFCNENLEIIFDYTDSSNFIYPLFEDYPYVNVTFKQPKTIKGFVIRDENGTEYHFGGNKDFIEYSTPFFMQCSNEYSQYWIANSWYLNKIVDRNGNILFMFEYQRGKYIAQLYNSTNCGKYYYTYQSSGTHTHGEVSYNYSGCPFDGVLNAPIYLSSITTSDRRRLVFNSSDANMSMLDLYSSMYSRYNNLNTWLNSFANRVAITSQIYSFELPFYYLQSNIVEVAAYQYNSSSSEKLNNPLATTRLRQLDGINFYCIAGSQTAIGPHYTFEFDLSNRMHLTKINVKNTSGTNEGTYQMNYYPGLTADYISTAVDHWGYYNGQPITTYPNDEYGFVSFQGQRDAISSLAMVGMLSQIIYPTGGWTTFEYESHSYSKYMNSGRTAFINTGGIAGGARIKRITDCNSNGNVLSERTFTYNLLSSNTQSSGELYGQPIYYWNYWESDNISPNTWSAIKLFKSISILPLSNKFGPHVGYSYVRETNNDRTYKVYQYSNLSDALDSQASLSFSNGTQTPYDVFSERDYKRGCLLAERNYDADSILKMKIDYSYRTDNVENKYVWTSTLKADNFLGSPYDPNYEGYTHFTGGINKLFYPKYDVVSVQKIVYNTGTDLTENTSYVLADYTSPVSYGSFTHNVDYRKLISETTSRANESVTTSYIYPYAASNDAVTKKLFSEQFFMQPILTEKTYQGQTIEKRATRYTLFNGLILPQSELFYKGISPDTTITYLDYTGTGAVRQYREQGKAITSLTWGWNDNYLLTRTEGSLVTQYTYNPQTLFLTKITQPNGNYNTYAFDTMGRLSEIRDRNGNLIKKYFYNYTNK
jgi:hypothetical protein